ncbi:MAG: SufE family protein [Bacteroidetes bacterium]|nr:SufE family protein [Bacteroidota bacterium]
MTIQEIENQIIEEFENFEDWMDKYNYVIELGRECPKIDEKNKIDNNLIVGCQSRVWLSAEFIDGVIIYKADSDAVITKGIASLLIRVLSNQKPQDIIDAKLDFINYIGLKDHLSPTRSNGLLSMIKQMKLYALVFQTKTMNDK